MTGLSFVSLLAYDYRFITMSLPSYYDIADEIILGLDSQRVSWSGNGFAIDMDALMGFISGIDKAKKIRIVEGNFHALDSPIHNDTNERNVLSNAAIPGNWIVQIDADEVLLNPLPFRDWLSANNPESCNVFARWITVFKTFGDQVLLIDPPGEATPVATRQRGAYRVARYTSQQGVMSPLQLLHFSWGRTRDEVRRKLDNWGHREEFDVERFFAFWDGIDLQNFAQARNFHPLSGATWQSLRLGSLHASA